LREWNFPFLRERVRVREKDHRVDPHLDPLPGRERKKNGVHLDVDACVSWPNPFEGFTNQASGSAGGI